MKLFWGGREPGAPAFARAAFAKTLRHATGYGGQADYPPRLRRNQKVQPANDANKREYKARGAAVSQPPGFGR
jgi:hypothetical protein